MVESQFALQCNSHHQESHANSRVELHQEGGLWPAGDWTQNELGDIVTVIPNSRLGVNTGCPTSSHLKQVWKEIIVTNTKTHIYTDGNTKTHTSHFYTYLYIDFKKLHIHLPLAYSGQLTHLPPEYSTTLFSTMESVQAVLSECSSMWILSWSLNM